MAYDPFADEPADEAQTAPAPTNTNSGPWEDKPVTNPATADDQNYVTVILKGGAGYGAPSISIRGASIPDALAQIQGHEDDLKALVQASARFGKAFGSIVDGPAPSKGGTSTASGGSNSGGGQAQRGRPANAGSAPDGEKRFCEHGERVFKSGVSKAGKVWQAYDCPNRVCDRDWKN